ncbi:MAG: trypsin-like serine protease [Pseudomonadota bacterium]
MARAVLALMLLSLAAPAVGDTLPPIAPRFVVAEYTAIAIVTSDAPEIGVDRTSGGCSGTLIAPDLVLTAAHCAHGRVAAPERLHVTFGWRDDGPPLWRSPAAAITLHHGYRPGTLPVEDLPTDLALIHLPRPVPAEIVAPIPYRPEPAADLVAVYGYANGHDRILRGHAECPAARLTPGLYGLACQLVSGFSGGPVLREGTDGPEVVGVAVAIIPGAQVGVQAFAAVPLPDLIGDAAGDSPLPATE